MTYQSLNIAFFLFHTVFITFILFAWLWKRARPAHLAACLLTAFSWGVLGIHYGFGYCPCTDWHWKVRYELGLYDMPRSYLKFLFDKLTGLDANPWWVDTIAVVVFVLLTLLSLFLNLHAWYHIRKSTLDGDNQV